MGRIVAFVCGRRGKWLALAFWIVAVAFAFPLSAKLTGVQTNDAAAWLPRTAESTRVVELQQRFLAGETLPVVVVYEHASGITDADQATATAHARQFAGLPGVRGDVAGPLPSPDGRALQVIVPIDSSDGWDSMRAAVERIRELATEIGAGTTVAVTGPAAVNADLSAAFDGVDGTLLYSALAVVVAILLLTYRSPVLWLLPVAGALVALVVAQAAVYLMAEYVDVTLNAQSAAVLLVLVFGAATDYGLLLIARYREELRRQPDRHAAMATAVRRVGPAIIASAATVAAGMLCLLAAQMNSTCGMGPVAAAGIAVALFVMLTMLPALLVVAGRWVFWPVTPRPDTPEPSVTGVWARIGQRIAGRPRATWLVTALVLAALGLGLTQLDTGTVQARDAFIDTPASISGEQVLARHFPSGSGSPVVVVARVSAAEPVRAAFAGTPGVAAVGEPRTFGEYVYLEGTLADMPDSPASQDTIDRVRDRAHAVPGAGALVGGSTATNLDAQRAAARDSAIVIPLVLLAVLLILAVLLRSILAPLILLGTVVLSFAAALGATALIFQALGFETADTTFPLLVFVFLVALGIDYNIFLMSSVREHAQRLGTRRGTLRGLSGTGAVITSAGAVLAGTFAVLATLPVVASAQIGIAVAVGVLLDTLIVRSVLVTAITLDAGRWIWWPGRLTRVPDPPPVPADAAPVTTDMVERSS